MAFSFFNYDKEGPGVKKNEPEKIGFIRFFELYFKNFWKLTMSGLWYWLLTALPIIAGMAGYMYLYRSNIWAIVIALGSISCGFATAGITNVTRNMAVDTHSFGTSDFFSTIKKNSKQAAIVGIINTVIILFLGYDIYYFYKNSGGISSLVGIAICGTVLLVFCAMRYYIWMILTTFKFKIKQIYINSFKLAFAGLKNNLIIFIALLAIYAICFMLGSTGIGITQFLFFVVVIFILPGYRFFAIQFNVFPVVKKFMIDPYYKEHPDDDIELRKRLGLIKDEYSEEDLY